MRSIVYTAFALWASFAHADIRFTRVTDEAGIQFRHFNGATGEKYLVETMGVRGGKRWDHRGTQEMA